MEKKTHTFLTGALVGIGLGLLIAPKEGSETRGELKADLNNLLDTVKEIDIDETKVIFMKKLGAIKEQLDEISATERKKIIFEKLEDIKKTCEDLTHLATENSSFKVAKASQAVWNRTNQILDEIKSVPVEEEKKVKEKIVLPKKASKSKKAAGRSLKDEKKNIVKPKMKKTKTKEK